MPTYRPCGVRNFSYKEDMMLIRTSFHWVVFILGLLLILIYPFVASGGWVNLTNFIGITIISVMGLNILTGYCGQISIGQSAFMAVGAYLTGILASNWHLNFLLALPCGAIGGGIAGIIFGLPSARIKGFYLAMATLAAQFIIPATIAHPLAFITSGRESLLVPAAKLGGIIFDSPQKLYFIIAPITVLMVFFARNLVRTGIGRAFVAIRDDDLAAEVMGINLFRYKLLAFFICSTYAGLAGGLWAYWLQSLNPDHFTLWSSIWYLGMLIAGGMGSVPGAIFGVFALQFLDYFLREFATWIAGIYPGASSMLAVQQALPPIAYGLIIILFLIFEPRGLAHRWELLKSAYRVRPFSY